MLQLRTSADGRVLAGAGCFPHVTRCFEAAVEHVPPPPPTLSRPLTQNKVASDSSPTPPPHPAPGHRYLGPSNLLWTFLCLCEDKVMSKQTGSLPPGNQQSRGMRQTLIK